MPMFIVTVKLLLLGSFGSDTSTLTVPEPSLLSVPLVAVIVLPALVHAPPGTRYWVVACVASNWRNAMATLRARAVIRTFSEPALWYWAAHWATFLLGKLPPRWS